MSFSLFWSAYTLKCYRCVPGISGACTDTENDCPSAQYVCGAMRIVSYAGTDIFYFTFCTFNFWGGANKQNAQVGLTENAFSVSGGSKLADIPMKSCFLPDTCTESSINFGISRIVIPNKCCNSHLCNVAIAPGNIYIYKWCALFLLTKVDFEFPQENNYG